MRRLIVAGIISVVFAIGMVGCNEDTPQSGESARQQSNYEKVVSRQPAAEAPYSPTRETINFWLETWGHEPGKLSYVYLLASNGQLVGYYVFEGLPVSYCASLTPPYRWERPGNDKAYAYQQVPAPAMDGVYYSGGQCLAYYGKDAVSGTYMEYGIGNGITPLIYEEPLPRQDVEPLGIATIESVR